MEKKLETTTSLVFLGACSLGLGVKLFCLILGFQAAVVWAYELVGLAP